MRILCGQCGRTLDVDESAGDRVPCSHCGHEIDLTGLFDESPAEIDESIDLSAGQEDTEGFAAQARKAMERKVRIECGSCQRGLWVSTRLTGKRVRCPGCGKNIRIPSLDELNDEDEFKMLGLRLAARMGGEDVASLEVDPALGDPELEQAQADAEMLDAGSPVDPAKRATPGKPHARPTGRPAGPGQPMTSREAVSGAASNVRYAAPTASEPESRKSRLPLLLVALAGVIAAVLIAVILSGGLEPRLPSDPPGPSGRGTQAGTGQPGTGDGPNGGEKPVATQPTTGVATTSPTPPQVVQASASVSGQSFAVFGTGGYLPAPPGQVYWDVTVQLTAGDEPVDLRIPNRQIAAISAGQSYACLGVPGVDEGPAELLPRAARRASWTLQPRQVGQATLRFLIPDHLRLVTLKLGAADDLSVVVDYQPPQHPAGAIAGTFAEAEPRNLAPVLAQPVMAALQNAYAHEMTVTPDGEAFTVVISAAKVTGTLRADPDGTWTGTLRAAETELPVRLRLLADGDTVLLYLADQPYRQLTYRRKK